VVDSTLAFNILGRDLGASSVFDKVARAADRSNTSLAKTIKVSDAAQKASDRLTKARDTENDVLGRVRLAEARLSEIRSNAKSKTSQIIAAENALSAARRRAAAAGTAAQKATKALSEALDNEGKKSGKGLGASLKTWFTGDGKNVFKQVGDDGGTVFGSGFLGALKTPVLGPAIIGTLGAAVATVMPAVGAIAAGGLVAGFGAGLGALGIVFAAKSVAVKNRWLKMLRDMGAEMKTLSAPFETTLTKMSGITKRTFNRFAPELKASFKTLAPALTQFGDDLGRAFEKLAPALQPVSEAFAEVLKSLGPGAQDMLRSVSEGFQDLAESVKRNPNGLADTLRGAGMLFKTLTDGIGVLNNINGAFERLTGGTSLVDATFKGLNFTVAAVFGPFALLEKAMGALGIKAREADSSMKMTAETTKLWTQGLTEAQAATVAAGGSVDGLGAKVESLASKYDRQYAAMTKVIDGMFRLQNLALGLSGAQINLHAAIDAATASVKENGKHLSLSTAKGQANQRSLNGIAQAANEQTESMLRNNKGQVAAAIAAGKSRQSFVRLAMQMGATRPAAEAMAKSMIAIPNVSRRAMLTANKADLDKKLAAAEKALASKGLTKTRKAELRAEIAQLTRAVRTAQGQINSLTGKTVTITTNVVKRMIETRIPDQSSGVRLPGRERGGPVVKGQPYIVGEKRAEVFVPEQSGTIYPEVPSQGLGKSVASGMAQGIAGGTSSAVSAAGALASSIVDKARQVLGIQSPSKAFVKLGIFVNQGFAQGLRGSAKQVQSVMKQLTGKLIDLSFNVGAAKSKAINRVLASLGAGNKALQRLANSRVVVAGQLKAAQAKLAAVLKERGEFAASIRDAALSFNAITNIQAPDDGTELGATAVLDRMRATLAKTKAFASSLAQLKASGLGPVLYRQIAEAGVEQGSTLAQALLSGGKNAVNDANSLQTQIGKASAGLGNTAANNLYQAGVDGAQGLVNGLLAKTKALDAASQKLAATIVAAIKRQLGIRSPSRVLMEMGSMTGRGFVLGIEGEYNAVRKAGLGLSDSVQPGSRSAGRSPSASGISGQPVIVQFVVDGRVTQQSLLKLKQNNGGLELGLA
jgi:hypothetical protein